MPKCMFCGRETNPFGPYLEPIELCESCAKVPSDYHQRLMRGAITAALLTVVIVALVMVIYMIAAQ